MVLLTLCLRALLEGIATRLVSGREAIDEFMRCTLLCKTREEAEIEKLIDINLQELVDTDLVRLRDDDSYESTKLGAAIVASSFSPDDGIFVYEELKRALQAFVMDGEMHIFYMFTPLSVAMNTNIDWLIFRDQLDLLDESGIRALLFVGVQPGFVNNMYVVIKTKGALLIFHQGTNWSKFQRGRSKAAAIVQNIPSRIHGVPTA